jgi:ABC-2 type transport system ATP-binding protein
MKEICDAGGAVFFSTHVLDVAEKLCNKMAMINRGKLVVAGDMKTVLGEGNSLEEIFMEAVHE